MAACVCVRVRFVGRRFSDDGSVGGCGGEGFPGQHLGRRVATPISLTRLRLTGHSWRMPAGHRRIGQSEAAQRRVDVPASDAKTSVSQRVRIMSAYISIAYAFARPISIM